MVLYNPTKRFCEFVPGVAVTHIVGVNKHAVAQDVRGLKVSVYQMRHHRSTKKLLPDGIHCPIDEFCIELNW